MTAQVRTLRHFNRVQCVSILMPPKCGGLTMHMSTEWSVMERST
jgi:hypothetical protein